MVIKYKNFTLVQSDEPDYIPDTPENRESLQKFIRENPTSRVAELAEICGLKEEVE